MSWCLNANRRFHATLARFAHVTCPNRRRATCSVMKWGDGKESSTEYGVMRKRVGNRVRSWMTVPSFVIAGLRLPTQANIPGRCLGFLGRKPEEHPR